MITPRNALGAMQAGLLEPRVRWTPASLLASVATSLAERYTGVVLAGEISGFSRPSSGHWYFTLKDSQAQIRCVMFRGRNSLVDFVPREGMDVELRGSVTVYEARGDMQFLAESMKPRGEGALYQEFLQRKARLEALGLFDAQRKRQLQRVPREIAVVTSAKAAALQDVLAALARRAPHVRVRLFEASVQGAAAAAELVSALRSAGQSRADTVLLVRGGGSIEDLFAFNDEALAHEIFNCPKPVISGVGHETDFTIADFVADLRAPTPTAAAEQAAAPRAELIYEQSALHSELSRALERALNGEQQELDYAELVLARLRARAQTERFALEVMAARLRTALKTALSKQQIGLVRARQSFDAKPRLAQELTRLAQQTRGLKRANQASFGSIAQRLELAQVQLRSLSPEAVLDRGYVILQDAQGKSLSTVSALTAAEEIQARVRDGRVRLRAA